MFPGNEYFYLMTETGNNSDRLNWKNLDRICCSEPFCHFRMKFWSRSSLPPAYVVRREGNVLTRVCPSVCPQGGYPYPIMLCNITQNAMGQPGGYPARSSWGGGTLPGGYPTQGVPCRGVPCWGGTQLGQPREYLLHGGRYASCVHAGGLSCVRITSLDNGSITLTVAKTET